MHTRTRESIGMLLKAFTVISAVWGVLLCLQGQNGEFMGGMSTMLYFTIQSNILLALICGADMVLQAMGKGRGRGWQTLRLMGAVSITLTGIVFCFVLAPTMGPYAWVPKNLLTHVAAPIGGAADWLICGCRTRAGRRDPLVSLLPPIWYAFFSGLGYARQWDFGGGKNYPYFFLNWGSPAGALGFSSSLPFMGVIWWIAALLLFLLLTAALYSRLAARIAGEIPA